MRWELDWSIPLLGRQRIGLQSMFDWEAAMQNLVGLLLAVTACSGNVPGDQTVVPEDILTRSEILSAGATNAQDAIERLRPGWQFLDLSPRRLPFTTERANQLNTRGPCPAIYLTGQRTRALDGLLSDIQADRIAEIRYIRRGASRPAGTPPCTSRPAAINVVLITGAPLIPEYGPESSSLCPNLGVR